MKVSVVTTLYHSAPYVNEFVHRMQAVLTGAMSDFEIIFVNDGSPDDALLQVLKLRQTYPQIRAVDLSRNFGHHRAIMTGLSYATGDYVFLIDCDLEEDPAWFSRFFDLLKEQGCEVVVGVQSRRKGGWFERVSGEIFYSVFNALSPTQLIPNTVTARLMTRRYVESLLQYQEKAIFLAGIMQLVGYKQVPFPVEKLSKPSSSYSLYRKIKMLVDAITSFSDRPLVFIFMTGCTISFGAGCYIVYLLGRYLRYGIPVAGWPSLIVSVWFLGGLGILFQGILGIYLSRIYMESKNRPLSIVRETHGFPS